MLKNIANTSIALAKVGSLGILKHVLFIGFSLLIFIIAIFMIGSTDAAGLPASGHTGGFGAVIGILYLFVADFWPMLLCTASLIVFPFLYFTLINKSIIHAALFQLWKKNLEGWFLTKIKGYSEKYFSGGNKLSNINDKATLKLKLISDVKNDKTNSRWQRKILSFLLKKIKLDDFDTNNPDIKLSDFLLLKATSFVENLGKPSNKPLLITFGIHVILIILAILLNN